LAHPKRGKTVNWENPNWEPLLRLARVYVGEFMWMCEVQLKGGISLHLYKHWWRRHYLHLTEDGRAFFYRPDLHRSDSEEGAYEEIPEEEIPELFDRVIRSLNPEREWLEECEAREGKGIPGYTDGHGEGDGFDAR